MKVDKVKLVRRLKILEGQIKGLQDMVEKDAYCVDIVTQSSAVKQGLSNVEDILLEDHLNHCVGTKTEKGQAKNVIAEVLKVYRLKRK